MILLFIHGFFSSIKIKKKTLISGGSIINITPPLFQKVNILIKKKINIALLIFTGILISWSSNSQEKEFNLRFSAQLVDLSSAAPVSYAHIYNLRTQKGTHSDTLGIFNIDVNIDDSLQIGAISFHEIYYRVTDSILFGLEIPVIKLIEKVYEIDAVEVIGISWKTFKHNIITIKLPEKKGINSGIPPLSFTEEQMQNLIANSTKTGIPFQLKSKRDKSIIKVNELIHQDRLNKKVRDKLIELIDKFSNMNGAEINRFIRYCRIPRSFILKSNDYEILKVLEEKFRTYKKK